MRCYGRQGRRGPARPTPTRRKEDTTRLNRRPTFLLDADCQIAAVPVAKQVAKSGASRARRDHRLRRRRGPSSSGRRPRTAAQRRVRSRPGVSALESGPRANFERRWNHESRRAAAQGAGGQVLPPRRQLARRARLRLQPLRRVRSPASRIESRPRVLGDIRRRAGSRRRTRRSRADPSSAEGSTRPSGASTSPGPARPSMGRTSPHVRARVAFSGKNMFCRETRPPRAQARSSSSPRASGTRPDGRCSDSTNRS